MIRLFLLLLSWLAVAKVPVVDGFTTNHNTITRCRTEDRLQQYLNHPCKNNNGHSITLQTSIRNKSPLVINLHQELSAKNNSDDDDDRQHELNISNEELKTSRLSSIRRRLGSFRKNVSRRVKTLSFVALTMYSVGRVPIGTSRKFNSIQPANAATVDYAEQIEESGKTDTSNDVASETSAKVPSGATKRIKKAAGAVAGAAIGTATAKAAGADNTALATAGIAGAAAGYVTVSGLESLLDNPNAGVAELPTIPVTIVPTDKVGDIDSNAIAVGEGVSSEDEGIVPTSGKVDKMADVSSKSGLIPKVLVGSVVVAGGGYAYKVYSEKASISEQERQEQFKLLFGDGDGSDTSSSSSNNSGGDDIFTPSSEISTTPPPLDVIGTDDIDDEPSRDENILDVEPTPSPVIMPEEPVKKRRGFASMFARKGNDRETDFNAYLSSTCSAPDFALLLAKILTYGAPGRFPKIASMPGGGIDMSEKFDLDTAKVKLIESRSNAAITDEESAEVFANVVNCMLIDIVDLASSTLKQKDDKITVDAVGIVVDFMNHAASLYDAVAENIVIEPVTYGGTLGKGKLEQMYGAYLGANFMEDEKAGLLQDVFKISEKKAQGIMQKNMMKMMGNLMKGEMPEGLDEEAMKAMMGGADGMPDMSDLAGLNPDDISPEQTKQMLESVLEMKKQGLIPKEELDEVRKQLKDMMGTDIDEITSKAAMEDGSLSSDEKEMLKMLKGIMED